MITRCLPEFTMFLSKFIFLMANYANLSNHINILHLAIIVLISMQFVCSVDKFFCGQKSTTISTLRAAMMFINMIRR